jgi:uncharacterized membrane protein
MKINTLLTTTALLASVALVPTAYAQSAPAQSTPAQSIPGQATMHPSPKMEAMQRKEAAFAQLPAEKGKLYKDALQQINAKNQPLHEQLDKTRDEMKAIMLAEKFDKAAYVAKSAEMDKLYGQMRANSVEAIASVAAQFTPAERKILEELHQEPKHKEYGNSQKKPS